MALSAEREISPQALLDLLRLAQSVTLIDVRKKHDFAADPVIIPGAKRCPPDLIDDWLSRSGADQKVIVYCVHGHAVSNGVVDRLRAAGHQARLIRGGLEAWKQAGGATIPT